MPLLVGLISERAMVYAICRVIVFLVKISLRLVVTEWNKPSNVMEIITSAFSQFSGTDYCVRLIGQCYIGICIEPTQDDIYMLQLLQKPEMLDLYN